ncbi:MAG TPA: hypothetical protein PKI60_04500 [Oscillospiraceae bacterium]|nr:hypothetical protein [Oscillospiraceae bacterium]
MINTAEKSSITISIKKSAVKTFLCVLGMVFSLFAVFFYTRYYNNFYFSNKTLNITLNILIPFVITVLFSVCVYFLVKERGNLRKFLWAFSFIPAFLCSVGIILNVLSTLAADSPREFLIKCLLNALYPFIVGIICSAFISVKTKMG